MFGVRAETGLNHISDVLNKFAKKIRGPTYVHVYVGHFIESIICDSEQNIWWGIWLGAVTALKQHNLGIIVDVAQPAIT